MVLDKRIIKTLKSILKTRFKNNKLLSIVEHNKSITMNQILNNINGSIGFNKQMVSQKYNNHVMKL